MVRVVPHTFNTPSSRQTPRWMPAPLDGGRDLDERGRASGSERSNRSGCAVSSGDRSASEIFGT